MADIVIPPNYQQTREGDRFLLNDDGVGDDRILIFSTDSNLRILANSAKIWMDGTFKSVPGLFSQLYVIHAMPHQGLMTALVYCLLPSKSQAVYRRVFQLLRNSMTNLGLQFIPDEVNIDFEDAVRQAVNVEFPNVDIVGCYFHYTQCLYRKILELGLAAPYKENGGNNELRQWVRQHAALALMPLNIVRVLHEQLRLNPPNYNIAEFSDYFQQTWLGRWTPNFWNHYARTGPRTNNHLEGFHSKLNKCFQHPHPNIFIFLECIKHVQSSNTRHLLQVRAGHNPPRCNNKYKALNNQINNLRAQYVNGEKTGFELLAAIAYLTGV